MRTRDWPSNGAYRLLIGFGLAWRLALGGLFSSLGVDGLTEATRLVQARGWPVIEAKLDRCEVWIEPGRRSRYWEVSAAWRYGEGERRSYNEQWSADKAPSEDDASAGERAAAKARYCGAPGVTQLRVSPTNPQLAVRNDAVLDTSGWSFVFPALLLIGGVFCLLWLGWGIVDLFKWRMRSRALLAMTKTPHRRKNKS
ncbi:hypothetical protein [Trinickia sp.]|uniref:hypothetical protein n=1 Tax=Trinickia sp. TaxID=2571163 RepID=UPI003F81E209